MNYRKLNQRELRILGRALHLYVNAHLDAYHDDAYSIFEKLSVNGLSGDEYKKVTEAYEHWPL